MESVLTRAVTEQGSPQAGLPRTASGYGRQYESLVSEGTKLIRIGLNDYGVKAWPSSYGRLLPTDVNILEVWPESHWPGFALRQTDVL